MNYTFEEEFILCKCGQYWLSNSSPSFWEMMQGGGVQIINVLLHFHWAILRVPMSVGKLWITPLRTNLDCVNVASIGWAIQVRVFEKWCRGRGTTNHFVVSLPLARFWSSWVHWKPMNCTFEHGLRLSKCGQYWLSHSSAGFWEMMQWERYN